MPALLLQKTIPAELLVPWGGSPLPAIEQPVNSPQLMEMSLDDTEPQSVLIRCGRIFDELVSTADLVIAWWMHTGYTNGPFQFTTRCDSRRMGDDAATNSWGTTVNGQLLAFPASASELAFGEIVIPAGVTRDNIQYGDDLDIQLTLLPDAARSGVSQKLYLKWVEVRLEIPDVA
ncbi:MAG: hypothetical protein HS101_16215 [Planctomycetia bacterium]|nr:hypothetical protein [Planctomycetia bacterium]